MGADDGNLAATGSALAGGAIAASLVEVLFDKGVLTLAEARTVLDRAMRTLAPHLSSHSPGAYEATQIIAGMQRGKFTERN